MILSFLIFSENLAGGSWSEIERKIVDALDIEYVNVRIGNINIITDFNELFWMIGYYGWDNVVVFKDRSGGYYVYIDGGV